MFFSGMTGRRRWIFRTDLPFSNDFVYCLTTTMMFDSLSGFLPYLSDMIDNVVPRFQVIGCLGKPGGRVRYGPRLFSAKITNYTPCRQSLMSERSVTPVLCSEKLITARTTYDLLELTQLLNANSRLTFLVLLLTQFLTGTFNVPLVIDVL